MTSESDPGPTQPEATDADPTKLEEAGAAIDDAKAAASRVARDETIETEGDLPTADENVPSAPDVEDDPDESDADGHDDETEARTDGTGGTGETQEH